MGIFDNLSENNIKIPLVSTSKEDVLHELLAVLKANNLVTDEKVAFEAVLNRERQGSTGLGEEIAIPHAKTSTVEKIELVIGLAPQGINFNSLDGKPVKIFFLILANPAYASLHIEALSEVAKATRNKTFCQQLIDAKSSQEILEAFKAAK